MLTYKTAVVATQSYGIGQIHSALESKIKRLSFIDKRLASKSDRLASIDKLLEGMSTVDQSQDMGIKQILQALEDGQRLDQKCSGNSFLSQVLVAQTANTSAAINLLQGRAGQRELDSICRRYCCVY